MKFDKVAVGKNTLAQKMRTLSKKAKLSKIYTNHCLRATSITELDRSGFKARLTMSISGHQSESRIRSYMYSAHVCDSKKTEHGDVNIKSHILLAIELFTGGFIFIGLIRY